MSLPEQICTEIADKIPTYELLDWIDPDKLSYKWLSANSSSGAIDFLRTENNKINLKMLSENKNPKALELLREKICNIDKEIVNKKINWRSLVINPQPEALDFLEYCIQRGMYPTKLWELLSSSPHPKAITILKNVLRVQPTLPIWEGLSSNPNPEAVDLLEKNPRKIVWRRLVDNTNPRAMTLLEKNLHKLRAYDWYYLSANPSAIDILKENQNKIDWYFFCRNPNATEELLKKANPESLDWANLSENPKAIEILRSNIDKIHWDLICKVENTALLQLVKENKDKIRWDVLSQNSHPIALELLLEEAEFGFEKFCEFGICRNMNPKIFDIMRNMLKNRHFHYCEIVSRNPVAVDILRDNNKLIRWEAFSSNPSIFKSIGNEGLKEFLLTL